MTVLTDKISVCCASCDTEIKVKTQFAGRTMPCPLCEQPIAIPAAAPPAPPEPPPAPTPAPAERQVAICSACGMQMAVKQKYMGKFVPCCQCKEPVRVPRQGESPAEVARRFAVRRDRIKHQCPACELLLVVKSEFAGRLVTCPRCHEFVRLPGEHHGEGSSDSGSRLLVSHSSANDETPFDLDAMLQLASAVNEQCQTDQLWSAQSRPRPAATPSAALAETHATDEDDTGFEISIPQQRSSNAPAAVGSGAPPVAAFPVPPGTMPGHPVPPIGPTHGSPPLAPPAAPWPPPGWSGWDIAQQPVAPAPSNPQPPRPTTPPQAPPRQSTGQETASAVPASVSAASGTAGDSATSSETSSGSTSEVSDGLRVDCGKCGRVLKASRRLSGQTVRCPQCGEGVQIIDESAASAVEQQEGARPAASESTVDSGAPIDLSALVSQAIGEAAPTGTPDSVLTQTLRPAVLKKIQKRIEAAAVPQAARAVVEEAREALQELCESRDARAAGVIAQSLPKLPLGLQSVAIKHLGELRDPAGFEPVVRALLSKEEPLVRSAMIALGGLGDRRGVTPLVALAVDRPEHRIRALDAVLKIGDPGLPALLALLERDDDPRLQHVTLETLGRLKSPRAVPAMIRFLSHRTLILRRHSAEMLAQIDHASAVGALAERLQDGDAVVRAHTTRAITRHPDPRFAERLRKLLSDPERDVKLAAIEGLGACGDKRAVTELRPLLSHHEDEFVMSAAEALGRLGDQDSVGLLVERLEAIGINVEQQATMLRIVEALRRIADSRAALPLVNLLEHPSHRVRVRIVEALGKFPDAGVEPALVDLLRSDPMDEVKASAARALGELGHEASIDDLVRYGLSDGPTVRVQSLIALGRFKEPAILPTLFEMVIDPVPQVRYQLASLLGELGDASAIPSLEQLAGDNEEIVRRAARRSLQALGDTRSEQELQKALRKRTPGRSSPSTWNTPVSSKGSKSKTRPPFRLLDLVPSLFVGLVALPAGAIGAVRRFQPPQLEQLPGGKKTLIAAGLLIAGGIYAFVQSLQGPVTFVDAPPRGNISGLSATADGKFIAAARTLRMIEIWDVENQRVTDRMVDAPSRWAAFKGDGTTLLAVDARRVHLMQMSPGGKAVSVQELPGHDASIVAFARSSDGNFAATLDQGGQVIRWNLATGEGTRLAVGTSVLALALSPDGKLLAGAMPKFGPIVVWEIGTGAEAAQFAVSRTEAVSALEFSPDGSQLVAALGRGKCRLAVFKCDAPRAKPSLLESKLSLVTDLAFRADGKLIAASGTAAEVWDLQGQTSTTINSEIVMNALAVMGNDGLAVGDHEESVILVFDAAGQTKSKLNDSPRG